VVIRPSGAEDVAKAVRYAYERDLPVSTRGAAHSLRGQSLNEGGLVLDMGSLAHLDEVTPGATSFQAGPGVSWGRVVAASTPHGLVPPVLTGYPHASLGGTLAACGWGAASIRHGAQLEHCLRLEVVTGTGERVMCGPEENAELFSHVLGGMGQFGLVTRVEHRLRRFLPYARTHVLEYDDLEPFLADARALAVSRAAEHVECTLTASPDGDRPRWTHALHVTLEADSPESRRLLEGLRVGGRVRTEDVPTATFLSQPGNDVQHRAPDVGHPWVVTFLPWSRLREVLEGCLRLPPVALGGAHGMMRLWPASRDVVRAPMLRVPDEELMALLGVFPVVPQSKLQPALALMSRVSDLGIKAGGRRHLGTWVHFDQPRWRLHFGEHWPVLHRVKRQYDPKGLLNPGFIEFEPALLSG
jgi:FAD/FMN-containing dehydrogenase